MPGKRRSVRLTNIDYTSTGAYFVTICVQDKRTIFGIVSGDSVVLSSTGEKVEEFWLEIPDHFPNVALDEYVVMPNHIHGILLISRESAGNDHINRGFQKIPAGSISSIVRSYKAAVTRSLKQKGVSNFQWQRGFYEHVIRSEKALNSIRQYIHLNPRKWSIDKENPDY